MLIRLFLSGRNYPALGQLPPELELPAGASVGDVVERLAALLPEGAAPGAAALVAVGGEHLGRLADCRAHRLAEGDELAIISPVAGG